MINFLKIFITIFSMLELNSSTSDSYNYDLSTKQFFIFYFLFFLIVNFSNKQNKETKLDLDIVLKYLILIFKTPNFLVNYILNIFKKIYIYLIYFKYRHIFNSIKIFTKKYSNSLLLWWRPLFKKTSYFGYYRSNRSKWIK